MKPIYDDGTIAIYSADCLKVLKNLGTVDHVITDPPYSAHVHAKAKTNKKTATKKKLEINFDHLTPRLRKKVAEWCGRNVRRWCLFFCEVEGVSAWITELQKAELDHIRVGYWVKTNPMPQLTGDRPGTGAECIEIAHPKGKKVWNGGGKAGIWKHATARAKKGQEKHPTQKPISLMLELILDFTEPGDVILDPFCGSGATLRAAKDLGRKAIGIEIDKNWAVHAAQEMAQEVLLPKGSDPQLRLIGGEA